MSVFPTSKHFCPSARHTPQNNNSSGKKKATRISQAGTSIKLLLVQCALCTIRAKQSLKVCRRSLALKNTSPSTSDHRYGQNAPNIRLQHAQKEQF